MEPDPWLREVAAELARGITANERIRAFTDNPTLIGAYAEASVRRLVRNIVAPLRVSHGAIIYEKNVPADVAELDTIVWSPCPLPALFEEDDFALVPRGSAFGILEIKRSNYPKVGEAIEKVLKGAPALLPPGHPPPAMGVICLYDPKQSDTVLAGLLKHGDAVALLRRDGDGGFVPDPDGMYTLTNMLTAVRLWAQEWDGKAYVRWPVR